MNILFRNKSSFKMLRWLYSFHSFTYI